MTLIRPEAKDDEWVRGSVGSMGFPIPTADYVQVIREELWKDIPPHYVPDNRYNRPSVKFLRGAQIYSLHNPDKSVREATALLIDFKSRRLIEQLLLGRLSPTEVATKVNSRLNTYHTAAAVKTYGHYYWNCPLLKADEWSEFYAIYEKNDLSNSMAILRGGPAMALHITGFRQHLESKEILRRMQEDMFFDFIEWKGQPHSATRTKAMTSIAKSVSTVDVRLSESDSALRESLEAFKNFQMRHAAHKVIGIDELAPQGTFTDSGADMKELPPAKEDENANG